MALRRLHPLLRLALLLPGLVGPAACVGAQRTYPGPRLPRGEAAVLQVRGTGSDVGMAGETRYMVSIVRLDGRRHRGLRSVLEVLPGGHVVELRWHKMQVPYAWGDDLHADRWHWVPIAGGTAILEVDAAPGTSYELDWPDDGPDVPAGPPRGFVPIVR